MYKKIENILFYAATSVRSPKRGLEKILDKLPVTNVDKLRYNYSMGLKIALPVGIIILVIAAILLVGSVNNPKLQTAEVPSTINSQNADTSLTQLDASVSNSLDKIDSDFKALDQISPEGDSNSL